MDILVYVMLSKEPVKSFLTISRSMGYAYYSFSTIPSPHVLDGNN